MLQHRERIAAKKDGCVVYVNRSGRALSVISNGIRFTWFTCCSHRGKEAASGFTLFYMEEDRTDAGR